jgi:hypothetical protein
MVVIRIVLGALTALLAVALAMPAIVLFDLVAGGSGLGLCADGLRTCDTPFYTVLELLVAFTAIVFVLGAGVAACLRALSASSRRVSG